MTIYSMANGMKPIVPIKLEVASPSFNDIGLDQQIEFGINDWVAVDGRGREFFGRSKSEAIEACTSY